MVVGSLLAVAVAALLAPAPLAARVRQIQCVCSVCGSQLTTCTTEYQCFTQYVHDALSPIAYGCVRSRNYLLCDNWTLETTPVACCDTDFCNQRAPTTTMPPPSLETSSQIPPDILSHILAGQPSHFQMGAFHTPALPFPMETSSTAPPSGTPTTLNQEAAGAPHNKRSIGNSEEGDSKREAVQEASTTDKPEFTSKFYPLDKPMVLSALFVGLFFLLGVLTFGFYILHKQSRTVKRLWKNRSQGEMTLSLVDVPRT